MSRNAPSFIPGSYNDDGKLEDAYRRGWNHGHGIACHNVPTLNETYRLDGDKWIADEADIREVHHILCHEAADHSRCYSPFEFTAAEFNAEGDEAGALWDAFEAGTADAIAADLETYTDEDYGIGKDA